MSEPILSVRNLRASFPTPAGPARAVNDVDFDLFPGEILGLVGESGSGKSVTALALLGLIQPPGEIDPRSEIRFEGRNLLQLPARELRAIRGNHISMVFQDPMTSLNPVLSIGTQVMEVLEVHQRIGRPAARVRAAELLHWVGLPDPSRHLRQYPHELSGGMRQRVMLAMALACHPKVLIADEPTTALDVTIQAQVLELLVSLQQDIGMSVLLVTHDLGIVAGIAQRVAVMYGGQIVEVAPTRALFAAPAHPYTEGLLSAVPRLDTPRRPLPVIPGHVPPATAWPTGCRFHPRCPHAWDRCRQNAPRPEAVSEGRTARCWLVIEPERRGAE